MQALIPQRLETPRLIAERILEALTQDDRRARERQDLERLIEAFAAPHQVEGASLP